jgi:hypothetical protein
MTATLELLSPRPTAQLQPKAPLPLVCAETATPEAAGILQSGAPSSRTMHSCPAVQWTFSQGSSVQSPVVFKHTRPAGQAIPAQGVGRQAPVVASQKESEAHSCAHADCAQAPFVHVWPVGHTTPAQLGMHTPPLQSWPLPQLLPAHGSTTHWRPIHVRPAAQPLL